jgi:hypothetical protein
MIQIRIFGQLLLVEKQKVSYWYKTISREFEFFHKSYATVVAMATMTFQDRGYFGFKVISSDPQILFHEMIFLSIINYFDNLKKILLSQ